MLKSDLKTGDRVTQRDGEILTVLKDFGCTNYTDSGDILCSNSRKSWSRLSYYTDDLRGADNKYDIMKVERAGHPYNVFSIDCIFCYSVIWRREEIKEMTVRDIEKKLGYKVKIIGGGQTVD